MDMKDREARRIAAAQEAATAQAKAGMAHPGADMVRVFSVAGFELADIFAEWSRRSRAETADGLIAGGPCGLGPCWHMSGETPEEFGQRVARAILQLIKEV